eukprot:2341231-Amphidinium_carterae.1
MKAHETEKNAEEGRVDRVDLRGSQMADVAANNGTREQVPVELSEEWKHCQWGAVCQAVRNFWLLAGPKLCIRPEQWPRVRFPAPEAEPEIVECVATAVFPAA